MLKRIAWVVALALAGTLAMSGCTTTTPKPAESRLQVVVAFYPFQFLAERIGGDRVRVSNLTQPGAEPHDIELTPRQVASLSTAGLVVYQKGFQAAVDSAIDGERPKNVLDTTTIVPLHEGEDADHATGHTHALDPHTWLDPENMIAFAGAIADRLASADPAAADVYRAGAARLVAELQSLDQSFSSGLATCDRRVFVTSHEAFGYLAERYDLEQVGVNGLSPDVEPSPARVAEVQRIAKTEGVTTIFTETLASPAMAEAIAGDLGLRTDVLDPLEGITAQSRGTDYLQVMTANLTALRTANGCR